MIYEWDPQKAAQNFRKHGVSFDEAITVFLDPLALTFDDPDHSVDERRFISIDFFRLSSDSCSLHTSRGVRTAFGSSAPAERRAEKTMRTKNEAPSLNDDLRPEYDLSKLTGGIRGKYYKRATAGTRLVLLEPDVAAAFPDGHTVNEALRALLKVARAHAGGSQTGGNPPNKPLQPATREKRPAKRRKT